MDRGKALIRATSRRGTATHKTTAAERATGRRREPAFCDRCGAIYAHRVWRRGHAPSINLFDRAEWTRCPACEQASRGEYWGRIVIRGAFAAANQAAIRRRIENVAAHEAARQPERRLVSADAADGVLEVLTTSQKLAHRIVHELKKVYRGRAVYKWSDDGSLYAVWERE